MLCIKRIHGFKGWKDFKHLTSETSDLNGFEIF